MIDEFKKFWQNYVPYKLHPEDHKSIRNHDSKKIVHFDLETINKKYSQNLKDDRNNENFQSSFDPKAIHTNMFCKSFIGNIENSKIIILYGNPGLKLGDYQDEHQDLPYIDILKKNLNFESDSFFPLEEVSHNTGGYRYWKNGNRFKKIIKQYSLIKGLKYHESFKKIKNTVCVLQSIGYHSTITPYFKPEDLPSSIMTQRLLHEYLLPKAIKKEIFIFSWRQSNFWNLKEEENVLIRNVKSARNSYFSEYEQNRIVNFLKDADF